MNQVVLQMLTSVIRTVTTTLAPTPAAVMMGTLWIQMAEDVMVCIHY